MTEPARSPGFGSALVEAGVVALVDRYAAGAATPLDATRVYLDRIGRHDPRLHAFADLDAAGALAAAEASGQRWAEGRPLSRIDGVPIGIKANIAVRGLPWSGGLAARRGLIATDDAACVAHLRAAGAVLLGTLHMDEAAFGATGDNRWYGRTLNPHGTGRSPGGSSAGPAAAVAAGLCAAAIGTDTMGSVRIPAACCGVVGLSPRRGTIDAAGVLPLSWSFDNVGVLGRSVDDVERVLDAAAGLHAASNTHAADGFDAPSSSPIATSSPSPSPALSASASASALPLPSPSSTAARRSAIGADLAVLVVPDDIDLAPAARRAFEAAQHAACGAGLRLQRVPFSGDELRRLGKALLLVVEVEAWVEHEALLRTQPETVSDGLRGLLEWGARQNAGRLGSALRDLRDGDAALRARLAAVAPGAGLLLPVVPCADFGFDSPQPQIAMFTALGSIAGLSGLSLPMALAGDEAPGAVQILSSDNTTTFALARLLADHLPAVGTPAGFSS